MTFTDTYIIRDSGGAIVASLAISCYERGIYVAAFDGAAAISGKTPDAAVTNLHRRAADLPDDMRPVCVALRRPGPAGWRQRIHDAGYHTEHTGA